MFTLKKWPLLQIAEVLIKCVRLFKEWLAFWGLASVPSRHQSKKGHSSPADATSCGEILFQRPEYKIHTVSHLGASPETVLFLKVPPVQEETQKHSMQPRAPKPSRSERFCHPLLHFVFNSKLLHQAVWQSPSSQPFLA